MEWFGQINTFLYSYLLIILLVGPIILQGKHNKPGRCGMLGRRGKKPFAIIIKTNSVNGIRFFYVHPR